MSSPPTKNESPAPLPIKREATDEAPMTPADATNTGIGASDPPRNSFDEAVFRRPRNPFILFRTWYIKQGHLKQVTSSGSELSKITGKLWKAMHEDDRKFWAEQARQEREASMGRPYAASKPRTARNPRKKASMASGARFDPLATRAPNPVDERMENIVQLIIAGKTGDEIGGELRKKALHGSESASSAAPAESPPLPLVAPIPRSARASVSLDALELQSHLPRAQTDYDSLSTSVSPNASLKDLPTTPEQHLASGYSTPQGLASRRGSAAPNQPTDLPIPLNPTPDFMFSAPAFRDRSDALDTEVWSTATTSDTSASHTFQPQPAPTSHKEYLDAPHLVYPQGWNYDNSSVPVHGLSYPPGSYESPVYENYTSYGLAPTATWHGPEFVSAYDVPGHAPSAHTGDLLWPSEWVNDSY